MRFVLVTTSNISSLFAKVIMFHLYCTRVADPYSFDTDPDPEFEAEYRSRSRGFDDKNRKKTLAEKKYLKNPVLYCRYA